MLDSGILTYGKTAAELSRGRSHGRIELGAAVISAKADILRIDIDEEDCIHHVKVDNVQDFQKWLEQLKLHRLYHQHLMSTQATPSPLSPISDEIQGRGSLPRGARPPTAPPRSQWVQEFNAMDENMTGQLLSIQQQALQLALLAQKIEDEQQCGTDNSSGGTRPKKLFGLRKKKSGSTKGQAPQPPPLNLDSSIVGSRSSTLTSEKANSGQSPSSLHPPSATPSDCSSASGTGMFLEPDSMSTGGNSSSSTLVNMSNLSTSNPSICSAGSMNQGRPVSLPTDAGNQLLRSGKTPVGKNTIIIFIIKKGEILIFN